MFSLSPKIVRKKFAGVRGMNCECVPEVEVRIKATMVGEDKKGEIVRRN
jgi:hypothetical protein